MIPYGKQNISDEDIEKVVGVLKSKLITQGELVPNFEKSLCEYVNCKHAVATNSATSALHLACLALELGPGDTLWTSANTFVSSANVALMCGADIDFIDIDPMTYNISIEALEEKLKKSELNGKLPKIIMPVHLGGQSCDMKEIHELSKKFNFKIIEDASHAIGGSYMSEKVGNAKYSDIVVFSFHPVKIITTGEGGAALTNCEHLNKEMLKRRSHGIEREKNNKSIVSGEIWNYQQHDLGFNYRMTDFQAALGLNQLKRIDEFIKDRTRIANFYNDKLEELPIKLPYQLDKSLSSYHLYPIRIKNKRQNFNQAFFYDCFYKNNILVNIHYIPVYRHPFYAKKGFPVNYCPEAEKYFTEALSLPIFYGLNNVDQKKVIDLTIKLAC